MASALEGATGSVLMYDDNPASVQRFQQLLQAEKVDVWLTGEVPQLMQLLHEVERGQRARPSMILMDVHVDKCRGFDSLGPDVVHSCSDLTAGFQLAEQLIFQNPVFDGIPIEFFSDHGDIKIDRVLPEKGKGRHVDFFQKITFDGHLPHLMKIIGSPLFQVGSLRSSLPAMR